MDYPSTDSIAIQGELMPLLKRDGRKRWNLQKMLRVVGTAGCILVCIVTCKLFLGWLGPVLAESWLRLGLGTLGTLFSCRIVLDPAWGMGNFSVQLPHVVAPMHAVTMEKRNRKPVSYRLVTRSVILFLCVRIVARLNFSAQHYFEGTQL